MTQEEMLAEFWALYPEFDLTALAPPPPHEMLARWQLSRLAKHVRADWLARGEGSRWPTLCSRLDSYLAEPEYWVHELARGFVGNVMAGGLLEKLDLSTMRAGLGPRARKVWDDSRSWCEGPIEYIEQDPFY